MLHYLESLSERGSKFDRVVADHRQSRITLVAIGCEGGHDDRATGGKSATQDLPVVLNFLPR